MGSISSLNCRQWELASKVSFCFPVCDSAHNYLLKCTHRHRDPSAHSECHQEDSSLTPVTGHTAHLGEPGCGSFRQGVCQARDLWAAHSACLPTTRNPPMHLVAELEQHDCEGCWTVFNPFKQAWPTEWQGDESRVYGRLRLVCGHRALVIQSPLPSLSTKHTRRFGF